MAAALTVACVYKPGNGFTDEYVYRLREGVAKNLHAEHRFVVLTNQRMEDFECIPLSRQAPGWWNKLDLFRAGLFSGQVAYLDLDTMIANDITDIVSTPQDFAMLRDFYGKHRAASGVMVWNADRDWSHLYEGWTPTLALRYLEGRKIGDQAWIEDRLLDPPALLQDEFPGRIVSYKVERKRQGKVPESASIICFHGKPRPADVNWRLP